MKSYKFYIRQVANKAYKDSLYKRVNKLKEKYNLSGSYSKAMKEKMYQPELEKRRVSMM